MPYDMVIQGGSVVDPSQGLSKELDLAITDGRIVAVEEYLPTADAKNVIDAAGLLVVPGLVDLHVHVFSGVAELAIDADPSCVERGTTTVVDAGSAGSNTIDTFVRHTVDESATRILAFLNISGMGQLDLEIGELEDLRWARVDRAVDAGRRHADVLVGIKVRLSAEIAGPNAVAGLDRSIDAAEQLGLPVMIHIGNTDQELGAFLDKLRTGDIVTHAFTGRPPGILDVGGKVIEEAIDARARGVLFDVGHGAGSFSFAIAEQAAEHGFFPDTISSDLHRLNVEGPVFDLATTLSKYLFLGHLLEEVIAMATSRPAAAIGWEDRLGTLGVGSEADIALLRMEEGPVTLVDALGEERTGRVMLRPEATVRAGIVFRPSS
ncbi:MAG: amidohydrolase/deacetylase family metallohydrolase [Acidimicrobiia bacterium]